MSQVIISITFKNVFYLETEFLSRLRKSFIRLKKKYGKAGCSYTLIIENCPCIYMSAFSFLNKTSKNITQLILKDSKIIKGNKTTLSEVKFISSLFLQDTFLEKSLEVFLSSFKSLKKLYISNQEDILFDYSFLDFLNKMPHLKKIRVSSSYLNEIVNKKSLLFD